jgi:hypothetical protein
MGNMKNKFFVVVKYHFIHYLVVGEFLSHEKLSLKVVFVCEALAQKELARQKSGPGAGIPVPLRHSLNNPYRFLAHNICIISLYKRKKHFYIFIYKSIYHT